MTAGKRNAWMLTLAFAALFGLAAWPMAKRIEAFNQAQHFRHYHVEPVKARGFQIQGFAPVKLEDSTDESGRFALKLTYGEPGSPSARTVFIPLREPPIKNVADLGIYDEWLRVLAINEVVRTESGAQEVKPNSEQLVIVVRRTPEGFDPASWGSVRRTEWLFDFYQLERDGSVSARRHRWPMAKDSYETALQARAAAPDADARLKELAAIPPLGQRNLDFLAALHVIPKLNVPKYKFTDTALSPRILGWTLPVCMLAGLGFSFAFFFAVAPSRIGGAAPKAVPPAAA